MRVLLLSNANSIHTYRWAVALRDWGVELAIFTLHGRGTYDYEQRGVRLYGALHSKRCEVAVFEKLWYLTYHHALSRAIREFCPDIVHAHYATSYGLLGALSGFHPYIVSVWGADVYDSPRCMPLGSAVLRRVLRSADRLLSTSHVMAREAARYTDLPFTIIPFGVDTQRFAPVPHVEVESNLFGCVKIMRKKYGIDLLIAAFAVIIRNNPTRRLGLEIVGEGADRMRFEALSRKLGIGEQVRFVGFVENRALPEYYSRYVASVFPSVCNESFGVVAVESMACGCPVIASNVDGFRETVLDGETGYLVPRGDVGKLVEAMQRFVDDASIRSKLGQKGREQVQAHYRWSDNVEAMLGAYREVLAQSSNAINSNE